MRPLFNSLHHFLQSSLALSTIHCLHNLQWNCSVFPYTCKLWDNTNKMNTLYSKKSTSGKRIKWYQTLSVNEPLLSMMLCSLCIILLSSLCRFSCSNPALCGVQGQQREQKEVAPFVCLMMLLVRCHSNQWWLKTSRVSHCETLPGLEGQVNSGKGRGRKRFYFTIKVHFCGVPAVPTLPQNAYLFISKLK